MLDFISYGARAEILKIVDVFCCEEVWCDPLGVVKLGLEMVEKPKGFEGIRHARAADARARLTGIRKTSSC